MDAERKELLIEYCHIDDLTDSGEKLLERFFYQAVGYMRAAGVAEPDSADVERKALFDTCVDAMVLDAWDNRRATVTVQALNNPAFQWIKNQLKFTEPPVSESDTTV